MTKKRPVEAEIGPIEICIFNVGGNVRFPILGTTERGFRKVWEMCAYAAFLTGREAARYMVMRPKGLIFFTGATASVRGNSGYAAFASCKFPPWGGARAMAHELGPQNIHVAHLVIDAGVDTEFVRQRQRQAVIGPCYLLLDTLMSPDSIAKAYWSLHHQSRDGLTFELDIQPFGET